MLTIAFIEKTYAALGHKYSANVYRLRYDRVPYMFELNHG
jgi:hypothetical protein